MIIIFAGDHAGFELKEHLKSFTKGLGFSVEDKGPFEHDPEDDYPDFVRIAAEEVAKDPEHTRAILVGGSGQGEAIAANRFAGVRAALYYCCSREIVKLSREHNNANVLSLGARFVSKEDAESAVSLWLGTDFSGDDRHTRRIKKIDA